MSSNSGNGFDGDSKISYTIRELLQRMDAKLDTLTAQLSSKAERSEVEALRTRVGEIQTARQAEREYGTRIFEEYLDGRETLARHTTQLTVLETSVATKRQLSATWVPILISLGGLALIAYKTFV